MLSSCGKQVYKLCLHFTGDSDHNMVTTALETLHQLLSCAPEQLVRQLLSPVGLGSSRSHNVAPEPGKLSRRTLSEYFCFQTSTFNILWLVEAVFD